MTKSEFNKLIKKSREYLKASEKRLAQDFGIGSYKRIAFNQLNGRLFFSNPKGRPKVVADVEFVGTLSKDPRTWLWAWANEYLLPPLKRSVRKLRRFGQSHDIRRLIEDEWDADEGDCWDMTALAVNLVQAEGAYRVPTGNVLSFLLLKRVGWASRAA